MTMKIAVLAVLVIPRLAACATVATAPGSGGAEAKDMRLVGHEPLQARSAYQPLVHKQPREAGYFIPAVTAATDKRCVKVDGTDRCKIAIQTNNVEVDDRGFVDLVDRADTGLHIVELTGAAKAIVGE